MSCLLPADVTTDLRTHPIHLAHPTTHLHPTPATTSTKIPTTTTLIYKTFRNYTPHFNQLDYHTSTARERVIISSIRAGKTFSLLHDALIHAWNVEPEEPHSPSLPVVLMTAPTFSQVRDLLFTPFKDLAQATNLYKRHSSMISSMEVQLLNNRLVVFRSLANSAFDTVRGLTAKAAYIDECQLVSEEAVNIVRGRLLTTKGRLTLAGTPKGKASHLYHTYGNPPYPPETSIHHYSIYDNPTIPPETIEHLRTIYPPRLFQQEVLGEWVSLYENQVYYEFDRYTHIKTVPQPNPQTNPTIYVAIDYNTNKNPALLVYRNPQTHHLYVFRELYGARSTVDLGNQLKALPYKNLVLIDDAKSGTAHSQTDYKTNRQILSQMGFNRISSAIQNPPRLDRYTNVNAHLRNANDNSRLTIDPSCTHLIEDLNTLEYLPNSDKPNTLSEKLGHASDALGYLLNYLSPWAGRESLPRTTQLINLKV